MRRIRAAGGWSEGCREGRWVQRVVAGSGRGEGRSREGDLRLAGKLMTRRGWLYTGWAALVS